MFKRFTSLALILALLFSLGGNYARAHAASDSEAKAKTVETPPESASVVKSEAKPNEKLRAAVSKLVADAKAGEFAPPTADPQVQPKMSNGLSKGAKIAIGVGIAIVVLAIIAVHVKNHLFDCGNRCVL